MANAFDKVRLKVAAGRKNLIDLSHQMITTQDFGVNKCICCTEVVPGDEININLSAFTRLAPMSCPTFGHVTMYNSAFFVPIRVLMRGFYEFLTNIPYQDASGAKTVTIPKFSNDTVVTLFTSQYSGYSLAEARATFSTNYDFKYNDSYFRFTKEGKLFYDLLLGLGYSINFTEEDTTEFSALPLLAFAKVYRDYFVNSQYQTTFDIKFEKWFVTTGINLQASQLFDFTSVLFANYEPDYFTSAYQTPNSPNVSQVDNSAMSAPAYGSDNSNPIRNDHRATGIGNTSGYISTFALELAERLTSFIRRNAHVGSRWIDQSLARFGVRPQDAKMLRSEMLGTFTLNIQVSDVMATASSSNSEGSSSEVGDYAGKGLGYESGHFSYSANEFGYLIISSRIVPKIGYYQGRDRLTQRLSRFSFFTPEFDSIGMQPIYNDELFADFRNSSDYDSAQDYGGSPNSIFGFAPRYSDYKFKQDRITGDFRNIFGASMSPYQLKRIITTPGPNNILTCGPMFANISDGEQYDRIFNNNYEDEVTKNTADHFFTIFNFDMKFNRPMISVVDHLDVEGAGKTVDMAHYGQQL